MDDQGRIYASDTPVPVADEQRLEQWMREAREEAEAEIEQRKAEMAEAMAEIEAGRG